jgi:hypothetical protein
LEATAALMVSSGPVRPELSFEFRAATTSNSGSSTTAAVSVKSTCLRSPSERLMPVLLEGLNPIAFT